jgi:hypothetical protein
MTWPVQAVSNPAPQGILERGRGGISGSCARDCVTQDGYVQLTELQPGPKQIRKWPHLDGIDDPLASHLQVIQVE